MGLNSTVLEKLSCHLIFTDGACSGNPGPGGWGCILVSPDNYVAEKGGFVPATTNNQMELMAVCQGLEAIKTKSQVKVYTDSTYVIRGATEWIFGWIRRGWKTAEGKDVANVDFWMRLQRAMAPHKVQWGYVRGHNGHAANERCDLIAVEFSQGHRPDLYSGSLAHYSVEIQESPLEPCPTKSFGDKGDKKDSNQTVSYLSVVDGVLMRHKTWPECQQRVQGRSRARFKKARNSAEELAICKEWGFDSSSLKSN